MLPLIHVAAVTGFDGLLDIVVSRINSLGSSEGSVRETPATSREGMRRTRSRVPGSKTCVRCPAAMADCRLMSEYGFIAFLFEERGVEVRAVNLRRGRACRT